MPPRYRSERTHGVIDTITLSDSKVKVDITPQYGGKVYALTDVPTGRSLIHSPSIHQVCACVCVCVCVVWCSV